MLIYLEGMSQAQEEIQTRVGGWFRWAQQGTES